MTSPRDGAQREPVDLQGVVLLHPQAFEEGGR